MPQKYTLEYLKENKVAVKCRDLESTIKVCKILSLSMETPSTLVHMYGSLLCVSIYENVENAANSGYFMSNGYTLIPAREFLQDWEEESELKKGDKVLVPDVMCAAEEYAKELYRNAKYGVIENIDKNYADVSFGTKRWHTYDIENIVKYNGSVTDTNVGEMDNAATIAAIRTHLTAIDNLLKTIE